MQSERMITTLWMDGITQGGSFRNFIDDSRWNRYTQFTEHIILLTLSCSRSVTSRIVTLPCRQPPSAMELSDCSRLTAVTNWRITIINVHIQTRTEPQRTSAVKGTNDVEQVIRFVRVDLRAALLPASTISRPYARCWELSQTFATVSAIGIIIGCHVVYMCQF